MSASIPGRSASLSVAVRSRFLKAVDEAGLGDHHEALLAEARECVHFFYNKPKGELPPGASKVGGMPDLPDSVDWPEGTDDEGRPAGVAEFLAQFDLTEVPAGHGLALPSRGHLWVFVRATQLTQTTAAVIYRDAGEPLRPRPKPAADWVPKYGWRNLRVAALTFAPGVSLPLSSRAFERKFQSFRELGDQFQKLQQQLSPGMDNYGPRDGIDGQIGGYSFQAEIDLARQYAITELGHPEFVWDDEWSTADELQAQIERGSPFAGGKFLSGFNDEAYRESLREHLPGVRWIQENNDRIQATADALQLLFMFRPSMRIKLELGDGMYLDFLMHRDALDRRDFSKVYCAHPMLL